MKHLTILVPSGQSNLSTVACIMGAFDIFSEANKYWKLAKSKELFEIRLAGVSAKSEVNGMVTLRPHTSLSSISKTNLVIIPASLIRGYQGANKENRLLIDWISKQYKQGAEIASICTGAFTLAATVLMDGKSCSLHWIEVDNFKNLFTRVNVLEEKLITDENGIYTNGGGYSFLNFMIYLVEKYYDRQTAIYCSKIFQIEMDRQSQSPFIIFKGQKEHGDEVVLKTQAYMERNLGELISVESLSARFAVSRRNFDRRFIKATGNTPLEYAQRVIIESAKRALVTSRKTINEVMYEVGYCDTKAFRGVFRKITGILPLAYRNKYNKGAMV